MGGAGEHGLRPSLTHERLETAGLVVHGEGVVGDLFEAPVVENDARHSSLEIHGEADDFEGRALHRNRDPTAPVQHEDPVVLEDEVRLQVAKGPGVRHRLGRPSAEPPSGSTRRAGGALKNGTIEAAIIVNRPGAAGKRKAVIAHRYNEAWPRSRFRSRLTAAPRGRSPGAHRPRPAKPSGAALVILGHHYQRDEVIRHADFTGDSFKLAQLAATRPEAEFIVFCGVHFMAESADILSAPHQKVILPDMNAGCTMADMADIDQVEECWEDVTSVVGDDILPVTYMNSTAALKAFVGRHGGAVCTSSNARAVLDWAFRQKPRVLFFPDQHLGRNTGFRMGIPLDAMAVWDPYEDRGGLTDDADPRARGSCSGRATARSTTASPPRWSTRAAPRSRA